MLRCVEDAVTLVQSFGGANWMRRVLNKGDYADEFRALNERLAAAQADLGFGVQISALIAAEQGADDAKADLEAIRQMLPILMTAVHQADAAAQKRHLSAADRQKQQLQLQQELAQMLAQIDARLARAELRSQKARAAVQGAAAAVSASVSPPASPTAVVLHIPLADLRLDPRPVGSGGFGDVYRAQGTTRHMTVAVKKLRVTAMSPAEIADFNREVAFLHALPYHEHVLQLHGVTVNEATNTFLMVMSWMEQGSLYGMLKASRSDPASLPLSRRLQLCVECALGVNHLHQLRPPVIHRDIKSLNFLIDRHGQVKVCDFGLARMRTASHSTAAQAAGTLSWMPPEFLQSDEDSVRATPASDVYSLAVVCWEVLTNEEPYGGLKYHQIRRAIEKGKLLPIPAHLPSGVTLLLHACWSMDPAKRPSCSDVIGALLQLQSELDKPMVASAPPGGTLSSASATAVHAASSISSSTVSASSAVSSSGSSLSSASSFAHWSPSHMNAGRPSVSSCSSASVSQSAISPSLASSAGSPRPYGSVSDAGDGLSSASGAPAVDTAIALYDFSIDESEDGDLLFKAGDVIRLLSCATGEDWWRGELAGRVGIFPRSYVIKQQPGAENPKLLDARCVALFEFNGADEDELSFKPGQALVITGELNGWYLGHAEGSERVGIFPTNYVRMQISK